MNGEEHNKILDRYERQLLFVARRSAFLNVNRIPQATRKFSGQARENTRMSIGAPDNTVRLVPNYQRNAITGELAERERTYKRVSDQIQLGDTVFVRNSLPYFSDIEFRLGDLPFTKAIASWQIDNRRAVNESKSIR